MTFTEPTPTDIIELKTAENNAKLQRIAQHLQPADMARLQGEIARIQIAVLLDRILGDLDAAPRQEYEIAYHAALGAQLDNILSQISQAVLLQGVQQAMPNLSK